MKLNRTWIFTLISTIALVSILIIQVNWIMKAAKIKEDLFNEKADMVLTKTAEALGDDKETCKKIGDCIDNEKDTGQTTILGKFEVRKIDSLLSHYMNYYNFHIAYSFRVVKPMYYKAKDDDIFTNYIQPQETTARKKSLKDLAIENGFELNLIFPNKAQFIREEMGPMFVLSIVLVLTVLVLFWQTILLLIKEKKISDRTTDFFNNMTHELKTPITNIALAGKMILKDPAMKPEGKALHYSHIILDENEKLNQQVEHVLNMTGLERGQIVIEKARLNLHDLINDSIKPIGLQIENRQGRLKLNLQAERIDLFGDKTHLTNAICNLIDNAIKYSAGKPELSIETKNSGQNVIVIISDQGIGIGKEYQKKVFEKYFRIPTGDVHNVKGFGLGLAYVKKIVDLHGGTIELASEVKKGTIFTITFSNV